MKKLALLPLLLVMGAVCLGQTTYTQTHNVPGDYCLLIGCTNAPLDDGSALSFGTGLRYMTGSFSGQPVTFEGTNYHDFQGSTTFLGYGNHYPYGTYQVAGSFNAGTYTLTMTFWCFRSCGYTNWKSTTVVGP